MVWTGSQVLSKSGVEVLCMEGQGSKRHLGVGKTLLHPVGWLRGGLWTPCFPDSDPIPDAIPDSALQLPDNLGSRWSQIWGEAWQL